MYVLCTNQKTLVRLKNVSPYQLTHTFPNHGAGRNLRLQFIDDFCKIVFDGVQLEHGRSKSQPVAPSLNEIRRRLQIKPSHVPKMFEILVSRRPLGFNPTGVRILDISCQVLARTKMDGCENSILQEIYFD